MTFRFKAVERPASSGWPEGIPVAFEHWYAQGERDANAGRYASALRCFEEASLLQPRQPDAWLYQVVCLIHLERPQAALAIADKLLNDVPDHAQGWLFRGVALHRLGRYGAAYASYDQATRLSELAPRSRLGASLGKAGQH